MAMGIPTAPDVAASIRASLDAVEAAVSPAGTGPLPLSLLAADRSLSQVHDAATLTRLRAVKDVVDPDGVIRGNHPLR